ncbi:MAG: hypothetical protein JWO08_4393 [Verrucomicrobiaceae bacterium]|nr:hypothetical protein [Verrucomicrobiaceae bacterium]
MVFTSTIFVVLVLNVSIRPAGWLSPSVFSFFGHGLHL